jgi:hypothetical protein
MTKDSSAARNLPWPLMINCPGPERERWAVIRVALVLIPALLIVAPFYFLGEAVEHFFFCLPARFRTAK